MKTIGLLASLATLLVPGVAVGQGVAAGLEMRFDTRVFPRAPVYEGQTPARMSPSVVLAPEFTLEFGSGPWRLAGEAFVRLDAHDRNRSHADIRELGLTYMGDEFTAFAGFGQVFWGVTEVRHLVDVVNQTDAVEDLDGEDRLGQPMISVTLEGTWGALDVLYLPYFRERTLPADDARLRGPLPIYGETTFASRRGRWQPGLAARFYKSLGAIDAGLSGFWGSSREPRFVPSFTADGRQVVRPEYDMIDQIGVDAQWTGAQTLLKLETITRGGYEDRIYAVSTGVEHTLYQVLDTSGDLGLIGEAMFDSRGDGSPPTIFDHDVFVGGRWAFNDIADTSVLGGPMIDLSTGEVLVLVEAERRIGEAWHLDVEARLFTGADPSSPIYSVRGDEFFSVSLARFF